MYKIRLATVADSRQLAQMRWMFTNEHRTHPVSEPLFPAFEAEFGEFWEAAARSGHWFVWVAEAADAEDAEDADEAPTAEYGEIIAHIYMELVHKVPRPGRVTHPFAYMTNVYTKPDYRSRGIGSKLLQAIESWVKAEQLEFVIVWPSEDGRDFYLRNGYVPSNEMLEFHPD
ncbi:GNAT family N-acetyltransferase [Paenibacillus koleovorans]|uniref:GNAT family N-acetyltransferase n=1 Tax=Paenibacillus koleovorans TaxID=121608 RepID=UPI001FED29E0|nr:GNAT family N-acetyltransferase [Paenibacillus koleovorans]